jgi:hypothetical protein
MRSTHKTQLKNILQTITFESASLSVNSYYTNVADRYPYCFITSGDRSINWEDNRNYNELLQYNLNVVFALEADNGTTETRMDTLEELIIDKLSTEATRNNANWLDLNILAISSPYQDDVTASDNCVIKTFSIQIRNLTQYA